jgi:hypothetical protein
MHALAGGGTAPNVSMFAVREAMVSCGGAAAAVDAVKAALVAAYPDAGYAAVPRATLAVKCVAVRHELNGTLPGHKKRVAAAALLAGGGDGKRARRHAAVDVELQRVQRVLQAPPARAAARLWAGGSSGMPSIAHPRRER